MTASIRSIGILLCLALAGAAPTEKPELKKLQDTAFIGNWSGFFNPSSGAGTQQMVVDIDEFGQYIAMSTQDAPVISGTFEAADGKWKLTGGEGLIDEGTYRPMGPSMQTTGKNGQGTWNRVSPVPKQSSLRALGIGSAKQADLEPLLIEARKQARSGWQKDAIPVSVKCTPNNDGSVDISSGANVTICYYSPSSGKGLTVTVSPWGEMTLYPSPQPAAPWKLGIPSNIIGPKRAMAIVRRKAPNLQIKDAELWGQGDDPDLRQFCWVMRTEDGVVCADAVLDTGATYRQFIDGRGRNAHIPFEPDPCTVFSMEFTGPGPDGKLRAGRMWYLKHAVYIEGMDEAIIAQVPWVYVPNMMADAMRLADEVEKGKPNPKGLATGDKFVAMSAAEKKDFLDSAEALEIACPPGGVWIEGLSKLPPATVQKIRQQLEGNWRRKDAR